MSLQNLKQRKKDCRAFQSNIKTGMNQSKWIDSCASSVWTSPAITLLPASTRKLGNVPMLPDSYSCPSKRKEEDENPEAARCIYLHLNPSSTAQFLRTQGRPSGVSTLWDQMFSHWLNGLLQLGCSAAACLFWKSSLHCSREIVSKFGESSVSGCALIWD